MRRTVLIAILVASSIAFLGGLRSSAVGPPLGTWLDPYDGLFRTARIAAGDHLPELDMPGLDDSVSVVRDRRGVPHIFAESVDDAVQALGYVTAQDRLFQMDFVRRVAAGRLAEILGSRAVEADRFLRRTGMEWGVQRNIARIASDGDIEAQLIQSYTDGVNAYLASLQPADLPLEFRLLGYRPEPYKPADVMRLLAYMTYDLTYASDEAGYGALRDSLSERDYRLLYPRHSRYYVPIIPGSRGEVEEQIPFDAALDAPFQRHEELRRRYHGNRGQEDPPGKGSNNWSVGPERSASGGAILVGDMHLGLSLPAIWYEVHLVTPEMNTYGVTIPGAPLPVEAFNEEVGWTFTNTGSDQIDHYALELDASGTRYRYDGEFRDLDSVVDTIEVQGGAAVVDTIYFTHWGPVVERDGNEGMAIQWVGHYPSRTLRALYEMNRADSYEAFDDALRFWDTPMQNILYADRQGNTAIRSTGYQPIRRGGHGVGLLDGSSDAGAWIGRIPFEELPHALNPEQGYLTSTNQQPVGQTYPYYLGHDWKDAYRSLRIDSLLASKQLHSVDDLKGYQADVYAVQRDFFVPLVDTLSGVSSRSDSLRRILVEWDGRTTVAQTEPLAFKTFLDTLDSLAWDEAVLEEGPLPQKSQLYHLLSTRPQSKWLDVGHTPVRERADDLLRRALAATVVKLHARYGRERDTWRWGEHHRILFQHLTGAEALHPLGRGPFPFPGFEATLSPAGEMTTTHSASWRMVVDFSGEEPVGYGVYPGGQSGNPASPLYDAHLSTYLEFGYYRLQRPATPEDMDLSGAARRTMFVPASN